MEVGTDLAEPPARVHPVGPSTRTPTMANPFRTLMLSGAVAAIVGGVVIVQMATWDMVGASGSQHAAQDAAAAQAIGRLDGAVSALSDLADAPEPLRTEAADRVDAALGFVHEALDATDVQSIEAQDALATARAEADAVAEVVAAARAAADDEQRLRHIVGAGAHTFELRRAQLQISNARQIAVDRLRSQGRLSTFALIAAILLCAPLAFSSFGGSAPASTSGNAGNTPDRDAGA